MAPMLRSLGLLSALIALILPGCTTPNPGFDPSGWGERAAVDAGPQADVVLPAPGSEGSDAAPGEDAQLPQLPVAAPPPPPPPPDPDPGLAQICTDSCPPGELCVVAEEHAQRGVCLRECIQPNTFCPVPDARFLSGCALFQNPELGQVSVCVIFCRFHGKRYPCPDETSYRCKSYGEEIAICIAE